MTKKILRRLISCLGVVLGSALYAAGFQFFLYENAIPSGGVTGVAMIINFLTQLPVGTMVLVMNIPIFALAWWRFGFRFILLSLLGTFASGVFIDLFATIPLGITQSPVLAAVYGGLVEGLGIGVVYRSGGTTGGTDVVAKLLRRRHQYINFGTFMLVLDVLVVTGFAVTFKMYENALYAIIAMYISSQVLDLVLYGTVKSKVCYIISDKSDAVKDAIVEKLDRGVTFLHGSGAYSGKEKNIILCVIRQQQIVELKKLVMQEDANAFMIVSDTREVFGEGFNYIGEET